MTPAEHKQYMENILNRLSKELLVKQPPKTEAPKLPIKSIFDLPTEPELHDLFVSPLQVWLEKGKHLVKEEIEATEEYVEELKMDVKNMQEVINSCNKTLLQYQEELNSELTRLDNLDILLDTILM